MEPSEAHRVAVLLASGWFPMDDGSWLTPNALWAKEASGPVFVDAVSMEHAWSMHRDGKDRLDKLQLRN